MFHKPQSPLYSKKVGYVVLYFRAQQSNYNRIKTPSVASVSRIWLSVKTRERLRHRRRNKLVCLTTILKNNVMAACGSLGIFMTRKVLGSLLKVSRDSTKSRKIKAEQKSNFWTNCEKNYSSIKLFQDTYE